MNKYYHRIVDVGKNEILNYYYRWRLDGILCISIGIKGIKSAIFYIDQVQFNNMKIELNEIEEKKFNKAKEEVKQLIDI